MRLALLAAAIPAGLLATGLALAQLADYRPGPHNITIPPDWQQTFIRYGTVDKPDRRIIRNLYINPEAFAQLAPGAPLPDGTLVLMADQRARLDAAGAPLVDLAGRFIPDKPFIAIAAQQKRAGWGVGYPADRRNGEWEYASFTPDLRLREVNLSGCFACHLPRAAQDFTFTTWDYAQGRR